MQLAREYRRKAAACGGGCAALAAVPALSLSHGHSALGFAAIGLQLVLLTLAMRFFLLAKQASKSQ